MIGFRRTYIAGARIVQIVEKMHPQDLFHHLRAIGVDHHTGIVRAFAFIPLAEANRAK